MDTNLTVADVKTELARFSYSDAELLRRLNRACQHFLDSDVFTDLFTILEVTASLTGFITIPPRFGRAYGCVQNDSIQPVISQWEPFMVVGMARLDPAGLTLGGLRDLGNKFCTQSEVWVGGVQQEGTLKFVQANNADTSQIVRIFGTFTDSDGVEKIVRDTDGVEGITLTLAYPSASTTQTFKRVDGIQFDNLRKGRSKLYKTISGTDNLISEYEPDELRPRYQRYAIDPGNGTVYLMCRQKHVKLINLTDWVYPDHLDAIELAFEAMTYRDRGDFKGEAEAWEVAKRYLKEKYVSTVPYLDLRMTSDGFGATLNAMKRMLPHGFSNGAVTTWTGY